MHCDYLLLLWKWVTQFSKSVSHLGWILHRDTVSSTYMTCRSDLNKDRMWDCMSRGSSCWAAIMKSFEEQTPPWGWHLSEMIWDYELVHQFMSTFRMNCNNFAGPLKLRHIFHLITKMIMRYISIWFSSVTVIDQSLCVCFRVMNITFLKSGKSLNRWFNYFRWGCERRNCTSRGEHSALHHTPGQNHFYSQ